MPNNKPFTTNNAPKNDQFSANMSTNEPENVRPGLDNIDLNAQYNEANKYVNKINQNERNNETQLANEKKEYNDKMESLSKLPENNKQPDIPMDAKTQKEVNDFLNTVNPNDTKIEGKDEKSIIVDDIEEDENENDDGLDF